MIGSFKPQKDFYEIIIPRNGWDEAPKGLVARGKYKANSKVHISQLTSHFASSL
jgi:hypothetical protein